MANSYLINTGDPRSITGHVVSGTFASWIISSTINYQKYQSNQINKSTAIKNTLKTTTQGGIATGAAIAATNHLGPNGSGLFNAMTAISLGMAGIYAVEVVDQLITQKISDNSNLASTELNSEDDEQIEENKISDGE